MPAGGRPPHRLRGGFSPMNRVSARIANSLLRLTVFTVITVAAWWFVAGLITLLAVETVVASALSLGVAVVAATAFMMRIYELQPLYAVGLFFNRAGAV